MHCSLSCSKPYLSHNSHHCQSVSHTHHVAAVHALLLVDSMSRHRSVESIRVSRAAGLATFDCPGAKAISVWLTVLS